MCASARSIASSLSASVSSKVPSRSNTTALNGGPSTPLWQGGMVQGPCSTSTCIALGRRLTLSTGHVEFGGVLLFSTDHVAVLSLQYSDVVFSTATTTSAFLRRFAPQFARPYALRDHGSSRAKHLASSSPGRPRPPSSPAALSTTPRQPPPPSRVAASACAARPRTRPP